MYDICLLLKVCGTKVTCYEIAGLHQNQVEMMIKDKTTGRGVVSKAQVSVII